MQRSHRRRCEIAAAYNGLGLALAGQERFDEAIKQIAKAAALWETTGSPDRKFALLNWARALVSKKLYEEAAKKCGEAIAVDPKFCARPQRSWLRVGGPGALRRSDRTISPGRRAVGER